jgi:hypothetical protein
MPFGVYQRERNIRETLLVVVSHLENTFTDCTAQQEKENMMMSAYHCGQALHAVQAPELFINHCFYLFLITSAFPFCLWPAAFDLIAAL